MKKSLKKIICLMLACVFALSAAACGETAGGNSAEDGAMKNTEENSKSKNTVKAEATALSEVKYPEMAKYPNEDDYVKSNGEWDYDEFEKAYSAWSEDYHNRSEGYDGYSGELDDYIKATAAGFLTDNNGENAVYAPVNLYIALSMLAELTDGESREQILSLIGTQDMDSLREYVKAVWNAAYIDDGASTDILAASLWLNKNIDFNEETIKTLAENYYAEAYQGDVTSEGFAKAIGEWLNDKTGGLLEEQAGDIEIDPETVAALFTTVYFKEKWADVFLSSENDTKIFHQKSGDVEKEFMNESEMGDYFWGEKFSAVSKSFANNGKMMFILPDEGTTPEELLSDEETMNFILSEEAENSRFLTINLSVPKFDISSDLQLGDSLEALGVTDVFFEERADFTPLTQNPGVYLSSVEHAARVVIDEEGCTAAAFTAMVMCCESMPPEETVDFILDRPFIIVIKDSNGLPLFMGIVNQP